tara:strand:- start:181 stop:450 length:270 start_codon:yes stop_codon:yes gene_type:complete
MSKDEEHIIDWILDKTDFKTQKERFRDKKRASQFDNRKHKIDNMIYYCEKCKCCWSNVPKYVDVIKWRKYPGGVMPTIGKKRKSCPNCK